MEDNEHSHDDHGHAHENEEEDHDHSEMDHDRPHENLSQITFDDEIKTHENLSQITFSVGRLIMMVMKWTLNMTNTSGTVKPSGGKLTGRRIKNNRNWLSAPADSSSERFPCFCKRSRFKRLFKKRKASFLFIKQKRTLHLPIWKNWVLPSWRTSATGSYPADSSREC